MAYPLEGPMPIIDLYGGAALRLEAIDPTTGATVAGVVFSDGVIYGEGLDPVEVDDNRTLAVWLQPPSGAS